MSSVKKRKPLHEYDHPYYCYDSNYFARDASMEYGSVADFLQEFSDADVDMNLIFRFDVEKDEENGKLRAKLYMIKQRKGIFSPITINNFTEQDEEKLIQYLKPHWERLKEMWTPISNS